jgi:hypothetical protein
LNGNVASDLTDDRQVQELTDQEALVVLQMCMSLKWHLASVAARPHHVGDRVMNGLVADIAETTFVTHLDKIRRLRAVSRSVPLCYSGRLFWRWGG